jgi:hypothetical protein
MEQNKRITASFSQETLQKLEHYKTENGLPSLAQCVSDLVDLGLKKEAVLPTNDFSLKAPSTPAVSPELSELEPLKKILTTHTAWIMENRLLSRYLVENMPHQSKEKNVEILQYFKVKAKELAKKSHVLS